jgi:hypothetical protein
MKGWRPQCHKTLGEALPHLTVKSDVSMLPRVGPFSTIKLRSPVRMVETDHAGFHVSGWKSVMERHSLKESDFVSKNAHFPRAQTAQSIASPGSLPCVALKSSIGGYHVNTRRLKWKFSGKN